MREQVGNNPLSQGKKICEAILFIPICLQSSKEFRDGISQAKRGSREKPKRVHWDIAEPAAEWVVTPITLNRPGHQGLDGDLATAQGAYQALGDCPVENAVMPNLQAPAAAGQPEKPRIHKNF